VTPSNYSWSALAVRWSRSSGAIPWPASAPIALGLVLITALLVDLLAPWSYVMTPLYAVPVLIAAHRLHPRGVTVTALFAMTINLASAALQGPPLAIMLLYTLGLGFTCYLAIALASQRLATARHAHEAEQARQDLERLMAMIAHDLRNPLSSVWGYLQLFERSPASTRPALMEKALPSLQAATQRMKRLTDDLLDTAQLMGARFRIHPVPIDLVTIVRAAIELRQATAASHPLILEAPERVDGCGDPDRLGQLVVNLLSNAIKYSRPGTPVRVVIERAEGQAIIRVVDQGPGIPGQHIPLLFAPFARLEQHRAVEGSGLGLHIVRGIVEAHGGQITVESELGQGSTFTVWLPLHQPAG
jgi:signal transduction histidine kinase